MEVKDKFMSVAAITFYGEEKRSSGIDHFSAVGEQVLYSMGLLILQYQFAAGNFSN